VVSRTRRNRRPRPGTFSPLLRAESVRESASILTSTPANVVGADPNAWEGPRVKVVLITEGLGNQRDMNYYGPEAMASAPGIFEGAACFLDHPSYTEERDIPERRVRDKCGYFKNVMVEIMEGVRSVTAQLHFDLSETGRLGYEKACTALHYQSEFPDSDKEYVGLSINAGGMSDEKEMMIDGRKQTVNYVSQFTEAMSCDIVTLPARGGKFLALVESAAGANLKNKEVRTMVVKTLQAAQSALKEAMTIDDRDKRKAKMAEAQKAIDKLLKNALESVGKTKEAEGETEADSMEDDATAGDDGEDNPEPGHTITKKKTTVVSHKKGRRPRRKTNLRTSRNRKARNPKPTNPTVSRWSS